MEQTELMGKEIHLCIQGRGMVIEFEWDEEKNASNLKKHGISFEEAAEIFDGPTLTQRTIRADEIRDISFGLLGLSVMVAVVHTDRNGRVRIISARKASKQERRLFNAHLERALG